MSTKLYAYDHCPFCVKARSIFGLMDLPFELVIILNDDVITPERLVGRKVAPILQHDGHAMAESMDIVAKVDAMGTASVFSGVSNPLVGSFISASSQTLYALAIPRWARADLPEFAIETARAFFTRNKEAMIGPFAERLSESGTLIDAMSGYLADLEPLVRSPHAVNGDLSVDDIHLFAHLRALSIVRGIAYPPAVDRYRKAMSERMAVLLHNEIAS